MFSEIYYFSGTGNSLAVARMINEKSIEKSEIIPIPNEKPVIKADRVGLVFPVYCHKIPDIVKQFILQIVTLPDIEQKRLSTMVQKVAKIAELIKVQKKGIIEGNNSLIEHIRNRIGNFFKLNYVFSPKRYKISNNCTGCGTCAKVCPVNNIHLVNHKPIWNNKCATCLACFHWCPQEAIYDNIYIKKRRKYHHPEIKINDMFLRK
jgi:ferredoxin